MQTPKKIAVVGSGLVGSLLGIYLKKRGHIVHVYDRSPDIRKINFSGRSINLVLSNRGIKTLQDVGLESEVLAIGIPVDRRAIHVGKDTVNEQFYGKNGEVIYSISRGLLNKKMVDLAEKAGVEFFFEEKVWDVDLTTATISIGETERGEWTTHNYDLTFGADGAFSRIRHRMQRQSMFDYSQEFMKMGYKELHIPANADGSHKLNKNALHIWPRGNFMLMALLGAAGKLRTMEVASIEDIDKSWMVNFHMPMGPFGILDSIGLDTAWHVTHNLEDAGSQAFAALLKTYIDAGKLGEKTGEGFYKYPAPAYKDPDFIV